MKLVKVPEDNLCKDQRGMFKCILAKYENPGDCKKSCPGTCKGIDCKVSIGKFNAEAMLFGEELPPGGGGGGGGESGDSCPA